MTRSISTPWAPATGPIATTDATRHRVRQRSVRYAHVLLPGHQHRGQPIGACRGASARATGPCTSTATRSPPRRSPPACIRRSTRSTDPNAYPVASDYVWDKWFWTKVSGGSSFNAGVDAPGRGHDAGGAPAGATLESVRADLPHRFARLARCDLGQRSPDVVRLDQLRRLHRGHADARHAAPRQQPPHRGQPARLPSIRSPFHGSTCSTRERTNP